MEDDKPIPAPATRGDDKPIPAPRWRLFDARDHLAADRTIMSNERTLLSYLRLSLTLFVAGMSFLKLDIFRSPLWTVMGCAFLPLAAAAAFIGIGRYRRCARFLNQLKERENAD